MVTDGGDDRVLRVSRLVTVVFSVVSITAAVWSGMVPVAVGLDLTLFVVGCVTFFWAYLRAIGRSREETISLPGLFFLGEGAAPRRVVVILWACLGVQIVVAVATAAARPFSSMAFGVLVPMFGLAMLALWGVIYGTFPPRTGPAVE